MMILLKLKNIDFLLIFKNKTKSFLELKKENLEDRGNIRLLMMIQFVSCFTNSNLCSNYSYQFMTATCYCKVIRCVYNGFVPWNSIGIIGPVFKPK